MAVVQRETAVHAGDQRRVDDEIGPRRAAHRLQRARQQPKRQLEHRRVQRIAESTCVPSVNATGRVVVQERAWRSPFDGAQGKPIRASTRTSRRRSRSRSRSSRISARSCIAPCPEVEETMKWSTPHFDYKGMFCGIAAFKEHVGIWILEGGLLKEHLPGAAAVGGGSVRQDRVDRGPAERQGADAHPEDREEAERRRGQGAADAQGTAAGAEGAGGSAGRAREEQEGESHVRRISLPASGANTSRG